MLHASQGCLTQTGSRRSNDNGPSHFFKLPGEIRNAIYAYALESSSELFLRMPLEDKTGGAFSRRETVSVGLKRFHKPILQTHASDAPDVEFNQLKYVCRQMYIETAGLEIKFNDIIISDRCWDDDPVGLQFLRFLDYVGSAKHRWFHQRFFALLDSRQADIRPGHIFLPDSADTINRIARLRTKNPSLYVNYFIPDLGGTPIGYGPLRPCQFVTAGVYYLNMLKGVRLESILAQHTTCLRKAAETLKGEEWLEGVDKQTLHSPRLRFWSMQHTLDEASFRYEHNPVWFLRRDTLDDETMCCDVAFPQDVSSSPSRRWIHSACLLTEPR